MNKKYILMASAAFIAFSAPAFSADQTTTETQSKVTEDANGNYSEKDSTIKSDSAAKTTDETKFNAQADSKGNVDKTLETKQTKKTGMFSKDSVKTKDTQKANSDGTVESSHKKTVNGTTTEESTSMTNR